MRHKKEVLVAAIIVLSLVIALIAFATLRSRSHNHIHADQPEHENHHEHDLKLSGELVNGVRVVKMKARRFEFDPSTIVVKAGEKVRLEVTSEDVVHGIGIEDFDINRKLKPGETETIIFVTEKSGRHHFHCSVYCGKGHGQMHGELVILSD